jgi:hypothetical protein
MPACAMKRMEPENSARVCCRRESAGRVAVVFLCAGAALWGSAVPQAILAQSPGTLLTASDPTANGEPEDLYEDEPEELTNAAAQPTLSLCQTDLRLSGTFYNAQLPQKSFATFHVRADHPGGEVYRVGERVGAFGIISVESRTVVLDDGGAGCYLKLAGASVPAPKAPIKSAKHKRKNKRGVESEKATPEKPGSGNAIEPKNDFTAAELNATIRPLGGDKYEIKKELIPKLAQRGAALRSTTQWSQVQGYSGVMGMRLDQLASNGLLERLGLRTGDMVKTLNGLELSSLDGALEAQKLINTAPRLSLLIQRNGTPVTLEYRVVP